jgi:response regulator RpfG family c-di-GMP phosphodiesterase
VHAPRWNAVDGNGFRPDGVEVSLAALLELAEDTSPELAAHMERTARLARMFAVDLGLSKTNLEQVVRLARVHDIGRLAMRDSADPHYTAGQKMLARKPALLAVGGLVRSMDERWDGTGAPDGLRGSEVPIPVRIVAVCSAFDDLTNPRGDHPSMTSGDAMLVLMRRAGREFDPAVVERFCDLVLELDLAQKN